MSVHVKMAARIAANLAREKRVRGQAAAAKWWEARFPHMAKDDYQQVVEELHRRAGKPVPPGLA